MDDPDQAPVDPEKQIKGYNYGKQLVPVGKEHEHALKYKGNKNETPEDNEDGGSLGVQVQGADYEKQFKLLGFTEQSKVPRHHYMGGVDIILPVRGSKNERAFAALVAAMIEGHKVIIAKIRERKNADPKLVVLYPWVSKRKPILYMVQLPTSEDIRDYQFPSLVPASDPQRLAARQLIQTLDLTKVQGVQVEEEEQLKPELTFNPALQYFGQVVTHRISNPPPEPGQVAELPPLNEAIAAYVKPDKELFEQAAEEVSAFEEAFKLEYVNEDENKKRQRVYWRDIIQREEVKNQEEAKQIEEEERIAQLKVEQKGDGFEFKDDEVKEITSVDPIGDFRKMVSDRKVDRVGEAIGQMQNMIERFVKNSLKGDLFDKALECLQTMRETCVKEDEAQKYNDFLHRIKRIFGKGSHSEFFQKLVRSLNPLSLITSKESAISSNVSEEDARKVSALI